MVVAIAGIWVRYSGVYPVCLADAQTPSYAHHGHYAVDSFAGADNGAGAALGPSLFNAMLAIAIVRIPFMCAWRGGKH